jgi:hypothetical protein
MPRGEADRARVVSDVPKPDRTGIVDQRTEHATALGQVADGRDLLGRHPDVDERLETTLLGDDTERAVPGIDEFDGGLHDSLQHYRKIERLHHGLRRAQQRPEPVLRLHHLTGAIHELMKGTVEFGPGRTGDGS